VAGGRRGTGADARTGEGGDGDCGDGGGDASDAVHDWLLCDKFLCAGWQPLAKKLGNKTSGISGELVEIGSRPASKALQKHRWHPREATMNSA
jgi:hypothetical protein